MRAQIGTPAEAKHFKRHLKTLTDAVTQIVAGFDAIAKEPESPERGKKLAKLVNLLEMQNDSARYFGLGIDFRTDKKRKAKRADSSRSSKDDNQCS